MSFSCSDICEPQSLSSYDSLFDEHLKVLPFFNVKMKTVRMESILESSTSLKEAGASSIGVVDKGLNSIITINVIKSAKI